MKTLFTLVIVLSSACLDNSAGNVDTCFQFLRDTPPVRRLVTFEPQPDGRVLVDRAEVTAFMSYVVELESNLFAARTCFVAEHYEGL